MLAQPARVEPARASLPSTSKWRGTDGAPEFAARIVKTEQEWTSLWRRLGQPVPRPLGTDMAVIIEIGERMTGGYRPEVLSASERNGHLVVEYTDGAPGSDAIVAQVLTRPWAIAVIPRTDLPTEFRRVTP